MKGSEKQVKWAMYIIAEAERRINKSINEDSTDRERKTAEYKLYALQKITEDMDAAEIIDKKGTIKNIGNNWDIRDGIRWGFTRAEKRNKDLDECMKFSLRQAIEDIKNNNYSEY